MKVSLRRDPVNSQGYNSFGRYFGVGAPLYQYSGPYINPQGWVRALSREAAKKAVRDLHPDLTLTFYR